MPQSERQAASLTRRAKLSNEWHARPTAQMQTPFRCTHEVFRRHGDGDRRQALAALCSRFDQPAPSEDSRHHMAQLGSALVKWEGHTEADSLTCLLPGNATPAFSEVASALAPTELKETFGEDLVCGIKIEVLKQSRESMDPTKMRDMLGSDSLYGGPVADGRASLWTSFKLDADGYTRLIIVDHELTGNAIGRLLQRVLECESYRMQAMSALPLARQTMGAISLLESELEPLMMELTGDAGQIDHPALLTQLSTMAARVEHLAAESSYRFAAARAYSRIVEQRLKELREERLLTQPRYSVFLLRSLQPAMRTCEAAERRIDELAQRISRAVNLLNSMVDMIQTRQTNQMMEAMSRNARMQLRLQQAVEGFSIFVISYYALGLLNYVLGAVNKAGYDVDPKLVTGMAAPVVLTVVWINARWIRRRMNREEED